MAIHGFAYVKQRASTTIDIKKLQYFRDLNQMTPSVAVVVLLVVLYQLQLIPPAPLVLKGNYICKDSSHENGVYQCQAERQSPARILGFGGDVIHITEAGEDL